MSADVLPQWMKATADTFGRTFDKADPAQTPSRTTRVLLFLGKELHRATRALRNGIKTEIANGVEAAAFVAEYEPVAKSLEGLLGTLRRLAQQVSERAQGRLASRLLARLGRIEDEVTETRAYLVRFLQKAKAPLPPLDPESLRRGREDAAAGRVEDSRVILQRLQSGGDL
jgi:hypothetical protein